MRDREIEREKKREKEDWGRLSHWYGLRRYQFASSSEDAFELILDTKGDSNVSWTL